MVPRSRSRNGLVLELIKRIRIVVQFHLDAYIAIC